MFPELQLRTPHRGVSLPTYSVFLWWHVPQGQTNPNAETRRTTTAALSPHGNRLDSGNRYIPLTT
jgi:hypothetical protein